MEVNAWFQHVKPYCFTIGDLKQLQVGEEIKFLVMDRNVLDICCEQNEEKKEYLPSHFFRYNSGTYTHYGNTKGKMIFHYTEDIVDEKFEFHVDMGNYWYPFTNGILVYDEMEKEMFGWDKEEGKVWTEFPNDTFVGWRGKFLKWDTIDTFPKVYF